MLADKPSPAQNEWARITLNEAEERRGEWEKLRARVDAHLDAFAGDRLPQLQAYADGVNAGLGALSVRPWPYLLLRQAPHWRCRCRMPPCAASGPVWSRRWRRYVWKMPDARYTENSGGRR